MNAKTFEMSLNCEKNALKQLCDGQTDRPTYGLWTNQKGAKVVHECLKKTFKKHLRFFSNCVKRP